MGVLVKEFGLSSGLYFNNGVWKVIKLHWNSTERKFRCLFPRVEGIPVWKHGSTISD